MADNYLDNLKEHRILREQKVKVKIEESEDIEESEILDEFGFGPRAGASADRLDVRSGLKPMHAAGGAIGAAATRAAAFKLQQKKWDDEATAAKSRGERT